MTPWRAMCSLLAWRAGRAFRGPVAWFAMVLLAACATGGDLVIHSLSFDTLTDGQDAEILDYRYGTSKLPVRAADWAVREGKAQTFNNVSGPMARGESLYVKWRTRGTGQIHEDTVYLRHRLPADITAHRIHFIVKGAQLHVYLVTPDMRRADDPPVGPASYSHLRVVPIYPDPPGIPSRQTKGQP